MAVKIKNAFVYLIMLRY